MKIFFYSLFTGIISFIAGQLIIKSHLSRFDKLVQLVEENLKNQENSYDKSVKEFREYISSLKSELEVTHKRCNELQKENDTISGIFIAFKEKRHLDNKKLVETSKALTNFI